MSEQPETAEIAADGRAEQYVIGVDGGGTKTAAALARIRPDGSLDTLAQSVAGPSNLQSWSAHQVQQNVAAAIENLFLDLPATAPMVETICFCMAGSGSIPHRDTFSAWANALPFAKRVIVTHDARPLIAAGTERDIGIALIAGTGSFAFARNETGKEDECGGWGNLFGDEGSAYWFVIEALRAASHACDGRGPRTGLVEVFYDWLGCESPQQWLVHLREKSSDHIASAAGLVSSVAAAGDPVAQALVHRASVELSHLVTALAARQFPGRPIDLALTGGFVLNNETLRTGLLQAIEQAGTHVRRWQAVAHPVAGALRIAADASVARINSVPRLPKG